MGCLLECFRERRQGRGQREEELKMPVRWMRWRQERRMRRVGEVGGWLDREAGKVLATMTDLKGAQWQNGK